MLKKLAVVVLVTAAGFGLFVGSKVVYQEFLIYRAMRDAAAYLFTPTEVKGKDGQPLTRAQLLDAVLQNVVKTSTAAPAR